MGYLLSTSNFNDDSYEDLLAQNGNSLPDVVLVKKSYPARRKKSKPRPWRLKTLDKAAAGQADLAPKKAEQDKIEADYEMFLRDLEEDPDLRSGINLYRNAPQASTTAMDVEETDNEEEEDFPEINVDELLDEMEDMTIDDNEGEVV